MTFVHLVPAMEEGGVERVVLSLTRELVKRGHESIVISRRGKLVTEIEKLGGRHFALDLKSKNPLTAVFRAISLARLLNRIASPLSHSNSNSNSHSHSPDLLVIAHSRVPAWLFVLARLLNIIASPFSNSNSNSHSHSNSHSNSNSHFFTFAHGANSVSFYSSVMTKGDRVLVPSKFLADYLLRNYRFDFTRIRVLNPCVDLGRFVPTTSPADSSRFVSLSIGRISPVKGFDNVIRDFRDRSRQAEVGDRKLIIIGGADRGKEAYFESLKALAASLGIADRVEFVGPQSNVPEWIAKADEVVVGNTTKPESFGLSVVEAFAMNKPVRLLRHFGGAGEIVDAVDAEIAAGRAKDYREAVERLYSPETMIENFLSICTEFAAPAR